MLLTLVTAVALCHLMLVLILQFSQEITNQTMNKNGLEFKLLVEKFIAHRPLQKQQLRLRKKISMFKVHFACSLADCQFHALSETLKQRGRSTEEMQTLLFVSLKSRRSN